MMGDILIVSKLYNLKNVVLLYYSLYVNMFGLAMLFIVYAKSGCLWYLHSFCFFERRKK